MEKLTLENIASYLPYGLKIANKDLKGNIQSFYEMTIENKNNTGIGNVLYGVNQIPVLRQMDLTKPIIVEGKEVIPIMELALLAFPGLDWEQGEIKKHTAISSSFTNSNFQYRNSEFITQNLNMEMVQTGNQIALFKWLYANKFDVDGLIKKGLAIDVNTLETNPYV